MAGVCARAIANAKDGSRGYFSVNVYSCCPSEFSRPDRVRSRMTTMGKGRWSKLVPVAAVVVGCGAIGCGSSSKLVCGPGTVQRGDECVVPGIDGRRLERDRDCS